MNKKSVGLFVFALLIAVAAFYGGFYYGQSQVPSIYAIEGVGNKTLGEPDNLDFSLFWDAWKIIQDKYADRANLDKKERDNFIKSEALKARKQWTTADKLQGLDYIIGFILDI